MASDDFTNPTLTLNVDEVADAVADLADALHRLEAAELTTGEMGPFSETTVRAVDIIHVDIDIDPDRETHPSGATQAEQLHKNIRESVQSHGFD